MNISARQHAGLQALQAELQATAPNPDLRANMNSPEEAAKTFEKVLVEQFVTVMTDQMFKSNLSGEDGPGWMKAYGDTQRKMLTEILSDHLVENGTFNISDTLLEQWQRQQTSRDDF